MEWLQENFFWKPKCTRNPCR